MTARTYLVLLTLCFSFVLMFSSCAPNPKYTRAKVTGSPKPRAKPQATKPKSAFQKLYPGKQIIGVSSYYGPKFHGRLTANGETFDQYAMTCAHKTLPFNTVIDVEYIETGRTVRVRVNDRGPFIHGRMLDLSKGAAERIGLIKHGTGEVRITIIRVGSDQ